MDLLEQNNIAKGNKIHSWTILDIRIKRGRRYFCNCVCICGDVFLVSESALKHNKTKMCKKCASSKRREVYLKTFNYIPTHYLSIVKKNAKDRFLDFDLDLNYLDELYENQKFKCALSGVSLNVPKRLKNYGSYRTLNRQEFTPSLDRIDSSKGYIKGNVQWVHKSVNIMKNSFDQEFFINFCKLIANNN